MAAKATKPVVLEAWQWQLLTLSTAIKLLLIPTYHSTDLEVHRNWLAVTHSLPLSQWYFDETSKWTLDYPPFFAYLSWLLSIPAARWDPRIVDLQAGLEYAAWPCKLYMRLSVIITELVLASALFALSRSPSGSKTSSKHQIPSWCAAAMLLHPGLVIIDHIHFQYNGFLYGILLWSVWAAREGRPLLCALLFSTLLNFKHIYIYVAPAYFVYLLQTYVIRAQPSTSSVNMSGAGERLFTLATITLLPFIASMLPLLLSGLTPSATASPLGILKQMLSRMFPFNRGLNHAYWAANAWALYTFTDRALVKLLGLRSDQGNVTRGILGDTYFDVLPHITAGHCFLLTLVCTLVLCTRLWSRPTYGTFVESIALFGLTSFLFGFHVHEKAVLIALLPLTLLSNCSYTMMRKTLVLSAAGVVGLFPLLFQASEVPIKIVYSLLWLIITPIGSTLGLRFSSSAGYFGNQTPTNWDLLIHFAEDVYVGGFAFLVLFTEFVHPLIFARGPFSLKGSLSSSEQVFESAAVAQNRLLSFASAAASSAVEAISQAVQSSSSPSGEQIAFKASSAASLASSAASSLLQAASTTGSTGKVEQLASQAAASASVMASAAVSAATQPAAIAAEAALAQLPDVTPVDGSFAFLPLMMISVYCALGVLWVWISLSVRFLRRTDDVGDLEAEEKTATKQALAPTRLTGKTKD